MLKLVPIIFTLFIMLSLLRLIIILKWGHNPIGSPPINKIVFIFIKLAALTAYTSPTVLLYPYIENEFGILKITGLILYVTGTISTLISFFYMDVVSLKFGIPNTATKLETKGPYSVSRNPMYVTFFVMLAGASLLTLSKTVIFLSTIVTITHHFIILKEERFLNLTFNKVFFNYSKKVRRYL